MPEVTTEASEHTGRHQRSPKNYLIDRRFQLKYAGFLVGIALTMSIALGYLLWGTSREVIGQSKRAVEEGRATVKQGQETIRRGREVVVQSRRVSQVVAMNIAKEYKDDPELAKTFAEESAKDEAKLRDEQKRLEEDAAFLAKRADELERQSLDVASQQKRFLGGLVVALGLLVVCLGLAGIVFTHKVAGPIFKMKRLIRQVGSGKLVLRERLRKGDELQDFFETFEQMVEQLRQRQKAEIAKVDTILERLEDAPRSARGHKELDEDGITLLKRLRAEMQDQLEA